MPNRDMKFLGLPGETLLFTKLGELGLGAKLLGIFDGGRIEEFIPVSACGSANTN